MSLPTWIAVLLILLAYMIGAVASGALLRYLRDRRWATAGPTPAEIKAAADTLRSHARRMNAYSIVVFADHDGVHYS